eukprot:16432404-Heterocapsa_arctica.AAC.1
MGLDNSKPATTPAELTSSAEDDSPLLSEVDHKAYRRIIGKVMYGSAVRPDLAFTVKELARKLAAPTVADWQKVRRLVRYLKGTTDVVLRLTGHKVGDGVGRAGVVDVYADANWAA